MPDFYLIGDESIILTSQNVTLEKELYEAILTDRRLILIKNGSGKGPSRKILLREVGSAIAGESILGEPTITLTFTTPDGVLHAQELIFPGKDGGQDSLHYNEWVKRLKEQVRIAAQEKEISPVPVSVPAPDHGGIVPVEKTLPEQDKTNATGTEAGTGAVSGTPAPESTPLIAPADFPTPEPITPESLSPVVKKTIGGSAIVAILIIAALVIGGAYYFTHHRGQSSPGPESIGTMLPYTPPATTTMPATTLPSLSETLVITSATVSPAAGGEVIIPPTGIWVRIQYPGNFTGSVGIQGSMQEITGSGDRFFRVPATGGIIDASIQKQDNSGNALIVTVYSNGTLVKQGNTTAPRGTLNLNAWI